MKRNNILSYLIAGVWIGNGLFCKLLNLVPRHQQIVGTILGNDHAAIFTKAIGLAEIGMAAWILSGTRRQLNAITQTIIIAVMNILEFILVPDLLLWGRVNIIFAFLFILIILYDEFYLRNKMTRQP